MKANNVEVNKVNLHSSPHSFITASKVKWAGSNEWLIEKTWKQRVPQNLTVPQTCSKVFEKVSFYKKKNCIKNITRAYQTIGRWVPLIKQRVRLPLTQPWTVNMLYRAISRVKLFHNFIARYRYICSAFQMLSIFGTISR